MKLKIYVIDCEIPARVKTWGIRLGVLALLLGTAAVAIAATPLHSWMTGDTLAATDLNGNFSNLSAQLAAVQGQVHTPSGFHAWLSNATTIQTNLPTTVAFNHVEFDLGTEYNATTGGFTPKQAGVYLLVCGFVFYPTMTGVDYEASLFKNGGRLGLANAVPAQVKGAAPEITLIVQLAANDTVLCSVQQDSGAAQPLSSAESATQFSAARLY